MILYFQNLAFSRKYTWGNIKFLSSNFFVIPEIRITAETAAISLVEQEFTPGFMACMITAHESSAPWLKFVGTLVIRVR